MIITPDRVANSIRMQRSQYQGSFLFVEGEKDKILYERFIDKNACRIQVSFNTDNKNNIIKLMAILTESDFAGVLAILDADFSLLENNYPKNPDILLTDAHDLEMMLIHSPAFDKFINEFVPEKKQADFLSKRGRSIRDELLEMGQYLGYLRWFSYRSSYGLNFNDLNFKKIVDIKRFTAAALDQLITIVKNNTISKSAAEEKKDKYKIDEKFIKDETEKLLVLNCDLWHICCGHDLICILSIGLRRVIGNYDSKQADPEIIERSLRLAYESKYFEETKLYNSVKTWEKTNIPFKVLIQQNPDRSEQRTD